MMPITMPAVAFSRPPYRPGAASISLRARAPATQAHGPTKIGSPQKKPPTSDTRPTTNAVCACGWSGQHRAAVPVDGAAAAGPYGGCGPAGA